MTTNDLGRLRALLELGEEENTPLREGDIEFLQNIDAKFRDRDLSPGQTKWFGDLVYRHLRGGR